ncbi:hypothetical protein DTO271D3_7192 [Paecilomyces variotii]|nr:hypothetical protein DTO271D3_7192 [Paecilomyces variotii]
MNHFNIKALPLEFLIAIASREISFSTPSLRSPQQSLLQDSVLNSPLVYFLRLLINAKQLTAIENCLQQHIERNEVEDAKIRSPTPNRRVRIRLHL